MKKIDRFLLDKFYILCILVQLFLDGCTHEQLNFLVEKLKRLAFEQGKIDTSRKNVNKEIKLVKENLSRKTCSSVQGLYIIIYYNISFVNSER